ncbi:MAG: hypothetical protein ACTSPB_01470 [Candidatus Thorarchaeota archaeon]
MIFNDDHVAQIFEGTKTQTRRESNRYIVGREYAIQRGRGKKSEGRILIVRKWVETNPYDKISVEDAKAEGGYLPVDYEILYNEMHPNWVERYCYEFKITKLANWE